MVRVKGDTTTPDLLAWEPPRMVERFDEARVRSPSLRSRIARAVGETLKSCEIPRDEIAAAMSAWMGEDISLNMLNAYASEAREDQTISYLRLLALVHVTGDTRLLQLGADMFSHSIIADRYLPWVEVGQLADKRDEIERELDAARRLARRKP